MVAGAVHLMNSCLGASNRDRQDSSDGDPAGACGVVANKLPPIFTSVAALTKGPRFTAGATLRINIDRNQVIVPM